MIMEVIEGKTYSYRGRKVRVIRVRRDRLVEVEVNEFGKKAFLKLNDLEYVEEGSINDRDGK